MITFFYTLNTELYDPAIPHLSPKTLESGDSDIYVTKFPVLLFIKVKGKNSPSYPLADGGANEMCPRRLQHYFHKKNGILTHAL